MITLNTLLDASVTAPLKKNGESNSFLEKKSHCQLIQHIYSVVKFKFPKRNRSGQNPLETHAQNHQWFILFCLSKMCCALPCAGSARGQRNARDKVPTL